ncbi:disintegrin and metalloproteinase domain-containing protein 9-like [Spea bombifrons]|uniref:disintegrin and metalloproteinase domain-containing protein 9-like n=1 Tax=Spea bombifrons TaxID=233779 RepID=UPI00234B9FAC|nr:disintegrin and metalloproteinase domain-containing protein 9-like [Spea bombifrons]
MWEQLVLLWFLHWGYQVSGHPMQEIVFPQLVASREKRHLDPHNTDENIYYSIQTSNHTLLLKLKQNRGFVSGDFARYSYSTAHGLQALNNKLAKHSCYYHGEVEGRLGSALALSTCHGLRGVMHMEDKRYGIEPLKNSSQGEHLFFEMEKPSADSICGVEDFETEMAHTILPEHYKMKRMKRAILAKTSYVELSIVVDNQMFRAYKSNATAVEEDAVQLVNIVDGMFRDINIRIVLTSLTVWSDVNPINLNYNYAGKVLEQFAGWREKTTGLKRSDISHLLIGRESFSGVVGMGYVGTVCSPSYGISLSVFPTGRTPASHASVFAHELGHNLGMGHDDSLCKGPYIMHSTASDAKHFSTCSSDDFEEFIVQGGGGCLWNAPNPNNVLSLPVCGNNIVDHGEECDCGTPQECKNPCCNAATCRLTSGSQCAHGLCCENCKFKVSGMMCRPQIGACDLPEYCNGSHALCPADVYIMNGFPCNHNKSYCHSGECQNYDAQCQHFFGPSVTKSADGCFKMQNIQGEKYGNCGKLENTGSYVACTDANSLCGKLWCTGINPHAMLHANVLTFYFNKTEKCISADFDLDTDIPDPLMVRDGTACAEGKACVNYKCVNASELGYNCDTKVKCNDRGVCNNKGNCHCDYGWAPPSCAEPGYGGSIDSGPTHIVDNSLRDGLLIFFFLVVPILIIIIVAVIKRDAIRSRICGRKRRSRYFM